MACRRRCARPHACALESLLAAIAGATEPPARQTEHLAARCAKGRAGGASRHWMARRTGRAPCVGVALRNALCQLHLEGADERTPLQMGDGQVQDGHKVLSARKRLGMVGVLAVVAGTAVFFNAEEQAAEAKIWDTEMAGIRNATAVADQQSRRFVVSNGLSWTAAQQRCMALGVGICSKAAVCRPEERQKVGKDMLKMGKMGKQGKQGKQGNQDTRRARQLCAGKGTAAALQEQGKGNKKQRLKGGLRGLGSVCSASEQAALESRWLPVLDAEHGQVWANIKTCEVKPSVPGEKEEGVVACCGQGPMNLGHGLFAAVHPSPVIQFAEKMVEQRKKGKVGVRLCVMVCVLRPLLVKLGVSDFAGVCASGLRVLPARAQRAGARMLGRWVMLLSTGGGGLTGGQDGR